jgi:hypothetical protein
MNTSNQKSNSSAALADENASYVDQYENITIDDNNPEEKI